MGIDIDQEKAPDCTWLRNVIRICFLDQEKFYEIHVQDDEDGSQLAYIMTKHTIQPWLSSLISQYPRIGLELLHKIEVESIY